MCTALVTGNKRALVTDAVVEAGTLALRGAGTQLQAVILLQSGRFAAGIFEGGCPRPLPPPPPQLLPLAASYPVTAAAALSHARSSAGPNLTSYHKVFKRYTTRRKAGGSQSAADGSGKTIHSAGASLRRHGEQMLNDEIRELLTGEWAEPLSQCALVFVSVPRTLRPTLFGGKAPVPFERTDPRLRPIPFMAARPTLQEVKDVHAKLVAVTVVTAPTPPPRPPSAAEASLNGGGGSGGGGSSSSRPPPPPPSSVGEPDSPMASALPATPYMEACRKEGQRAVAALEEALSLRAKALDALESSALPRELELDAPHECGVTALHAAAAAGRADLVMLLLRAGANPEVLDDHRRVPYFGADDSKAVRDAFRIFRAEAPERWDWEKAAVPEPLTAALLTAKKEKEREKKARQRQRKRAEKQAAKAEGEKRAAEEAERAAAEEAAILAGKTCHSCAGVIRGAAFQRLEFRYCSSACVQAHKRELMAEAALRRLG